MSLFSAHWYRVENLKPKLRPHARIDRHHYRGDRWYVLHDAITGRHHRFNPATYYILSLMDGYRTVSQIWDAAMTHLGDDAPDQNAVINLLSQLHAADLLQSDITSDSAEVFERFTKNQKKEWKSRLSNPMYARFPLWDPDDFLKRTLPFVEPVFSWVGGLVWLLVVGWASLQLGTHWEELTAPGLSAVLEPKGALIMILVYPVVKLIHELGHAYSTRVFGGEVHELGVMLLVLMPVPYVDASASSSFGNPRKRMLVGAAGVLVELFLASIALLIWIEIAPGIVRTVLWNVMLVGGISTLFFNANPLLRFDGYYVVADFLEIPNFASRANQYLAYLFQHYVLGLPERRKQNMAPGERTWFVLYGTTSWVYRLSITLGIAFYLAGQFFFIGVLLAIWGVVMQLGIPTVRGIVRLKQDPRVPDRVLRVLAGGGAAATALVLLIFVVPIPSWTTAEGVIWLPEKSQIRAGTDGFVVGLRKAPDSAVETGQALIDTHDPIRAAELAVIEARLREARGRWGQEREENLVGAEIVEEELLSLEAELRDARAEAQRALLRSPAAGRFVVPEAQNLQGRFVRRGELVAYVADLEAPTVRTIVSEDDMPAVRDRTTHVNVRLSERGGVVYAARIDRMVPAATNELPSLALGAQGGGAIAVDGREESGLKTTRPFFELDLGLPDGADVAGIGGRVYVRFEHEAEPLAPRVARAARRLFMEELGV